MSTTTNWPRSITDTTNGRCEAHLTVRGEDFRCDLSAEHDGWAHSSQGAEAIWTPANGLPTEATR